MWTSRALGACGWLTAFASWTGGIYVIGMSLAFNDAKGIDVQFWLIVMGSTFAGSLFMTALADYLRHRAPQSAPESLQAPEPVHNTFVVHAGAQEPQRIIAQPDSSLAVWAEKQLNGHHVTHP